MTKNMKTLLDDKELAKEYRGLGKNNIKSNFSLERHIEKLQDILQSSIAQ